MLSLATRRRAQVIAAALRAAAPQGIHAAYETLITHLTDAVEFRHEPPVPSLDGFRSRAESAHYLRLELAAFPRAFTGDPVVTVAEPVIDGDWVRVPEVHWTGTLTPSGRQVDVGMGLELRTDEHGIVVIGGTVLPTTRREDLISWLKAVAAAGGFEPGPGHPAGGSQ